MATFEESLALVVAAPEEKEELDFDLMNFQSKLMKMDLAKIHEEHWSLHVPIGSSKAEWSSLPTITKPNKPL